MDALQQYKELYNRSNADTAENFLYHFNEEFHGIEVRGKRILEIGCGSGFVSLYLASVLGVGHLDAMDEAEGEGNPSTILDSLETNVRSLGLTNITVLKKDIMQFTSSEPYDIVVSNNAMHHVCEHGLLKWDVRARKKYVEIFGHLKSLLRPEGTLLLREYSRYSIWRFLPGRYQEVEWSLHPTKGEWLRVLRQAAFRNISYQYSCPYTLRVGAAVVRNPIVQALNYPCFHIRATA
jgi:2-polyprenyl-3-methyl-5-hydroxy-6-metoxy-1,4-benzoquinol methylase